MKEKGDKYLDDFARKIMKETSMDRPSFNFTDAVMSKVEALNEDNATVYKPLISKTAWLLIGFATIVLVLYALLFGSNTETPSWIQSLDLSRLSNLNIVDALPSISISKTFTYAIVFFGLMIGLQVILLKNRFNKRFEL
ncbi:hypothetical protein [Changchengzhania lutea]|uniref:hypothetical protein n=1 Tax=Changchengzhania lutea TaxID=2049305 RepID=UPI00115D532D|nr:hypothetical protein [Changchengzhania lutea]